MYVQIYEIINQMSLFIKEKSSKEIKTKPENADV